MGLALDEPSDDDETVQSEGLTFLLGKNIVSYLQPGENIRVDFDPHWRHLTVKTAWSSSCD